MFSITVPWCCWFSLQELQDMVSFSPSILYAFNNPFISTVRATFIALLLNSIVHFVMYSYYLAAAVLRKEVVARLTPVKRYITIMQMVQFAIILTYLAIHRLWYKCQYIDSFYAAFAAAVAVMFYSFYQFYKKSYTKENMRASKDINMNNVCTLNPAN